MQARKDQLCLSTVGSRDQSISQILKNAEKDKKDGYHDQAMRLYHEAADRGNAQAQFYLAEHYLNIEQNEKKAIHFYIKSANQGHADAQYMLGLFYEEAIAVAQDVNKARRLFELSANQGNSKAQNHLGSRYLNGIGVPQDVQKAVNYYRLAASQENPVAQYNLGSLYYHGIGVKQNYKEAAHLYRLASDQGEVKAQYGLAEMYKSGLGVEKNENEAARLYRLAAVQNDIRAEYAFTKLLTEYQTSPIVIYHFSMLALCKHKDTLSAPAIKEAFNILLINRLDENLLLEILAEDYKTVKALIEPHNTRIVMVNIQNSLIKLILSKINDENYLPDVIKMLIFSYLFFINSNWNQPLSLCDRKYFTTINKPKTFFNNSATFKVPSDLKEIWDLFNPIEGYANSSTPKDDQNDARLLLSDCFDMLIEISGNDHSKKTQELLEDYLIKIGYKKSVINSIEYLDILNKTDVNIQNYIKAHLPKQTLS